MYYGSTQNGLPTQDYPVRHCSENLETNPDPVLGDIVGLHSAIQDVFQWNHSHLHEFIYDDKVHRKRILLGIPSDNYESAEIEIYPSWKHKMSKYLNLEEPYLKYVYDLGDNWLHMIELEKILPAEKGVTYPVCIGGKLNSPPDDCGGTHGYAELLEVLADLTDEGYEATKGWVESVKGGAFDLKHFDPREVTFMDPKQRYKDILSNTGE